MTAKQCCALVGSGCGPRRPVRGAGAVDRRPRLRVALPLLHRGELEQRLVVGARAASSIGDVVRAEAPDDRREHRVGDRERAEEERPVAPRARAALAPQSRARGGRRPRSRGSSCRRGTRAVTSIDMSRRRLAKPECISALTERASARAARSSGHSFASGKSSATYSQIASESQTTSSPWCSAGTRATARAPRWSSRQPGVSNGSTRSRNAMPACRSKSTRPQRPRREVLVAEDEQEVGVRHPSLMRLFTDPELHAEAGAPDARHVVVGVRVGKRSIHFRSTADATW